MNKIALFPLILVIVYSCSDLQDSEKANTALIGIDLVKDSLAKRDEISKYSIHTVALKAPGLYLTQGFGRVDNLIRLVKLYPDKFVVLDSIWTLQEIDVYKQEKVVYNYKNDWFIYSSIGSGTGSLSNTFTLVRVENNHFSELFTYSKNASVIDVEYEGKSHLPYSWVKIEALEMNKRQLVLKTEFEHGTENTSAPSEIRIIDTVTFEFSKTLNKFVLKSPIVPMLKKEFWMDKKGEYLFRI